MTAFLEELLRMGFLKIGPPDFLARDMRCDGDDWDTRAMTVEEAIDKMQVARAATAGADRERTCEMGFGAGGEGCPSS